MGWWDINNSEQKAWSLLKKWGFEIQQLDWIGRKNNNWTIFEIKERELFQPPPFLGTGLDKRQLYLRTELLNDKGLRTILLVYEKGTDKVYWQYIDVLEKGEYFDTKKKIRIYPIDNFKRIGIKKEKIRGEIWVH